jgi:flagellar motor switch/type III secretory pathway protein FliN
MEDLKTKPTELPSAPPSAQWEEVGWLPCLLTVELPVPGFTVRDVLQLGVDAVLDLRWSNSADVPLRANSKLLGWVEFEVVGERLAVRLTELS